MEPFNGQKTANDIYFSQTNNRASVLGCIQKELRMFIFFAEECITQNVLLIPNVISKQSTLEDKACF